MILSMLCIFTSSQTSCHFGCYISRNSIWMDIENHLSYSFLYTFKIVLFISHIKSTTQYTNPLLIWRKPLVNYFVITTRNWVTLFPNVLWKLNYYIIFARNMITQLPNATHSPKSILLLLLLPMMSFFYYKLLCLYHKIEVIVN